MIGSFDRTRCNVRELWITQNIQKKNLFYSVNSWAMENSCKLLDYFYDLSKLYWKAFFWLPVERLVLNKKNNGLGCHQLFSLKEKQRSCTHSCQHVSSRYNFEIVGGKRAARPLLSSSLPKTYSDGAVGETTVTEQKRLKVAHVKVGYLAHFLPTISSSHLFCMGNLGV